LFLALRSWTEKTGRAEGEGLMSITTEYASFLLRLWREATSGRLEPAADWQSEIEHIQSGQHWTFDTLDDLLDFLRQQAHNPEGMAWSAGE
jgi:hypothetical protein